MNCRRRCCDIFLPRPADFCFLILPCHVEELLHCPRAFFSSRPKAHTVFSLDVSHFVVPSRQEDNTGANVCVSVSLRAYECETLAFNWQHDTMITRCQINKQTDRRGKNDPVARSFVPFEYVNSTVIIHSLHPVSANYSSLIQS